MKWILLAVLAVGNAHADDLRKPNRVWELTKYLHGTTEEVRDQLNGELERQIDKQEDAAKIVRDLDQQLRVKSEEAVQFTRTRPDYLKLATNCDAARKERDALKSELDNARAAGTSSNERLELSAKYNRVRLEVERIEGLGAVMIQSAPLTYTECVELRQKLKDAEASWARAKEARDQSEKWRNKLLGATRTSFEICGPLGKGSMGFAGEVTCEKIFDADSMLVSALVPWGPAAPQGEKEGITTFSVPVKNVNLGIAGIDTTKLKEGAKVRIDQTIEVVDVQFEGAIVFLCKRVDSDAEDLLKRITPLLSREDRAKRKAATRPTSATKPIDEITKLRMENEALKEKLKQRR